MPCARAPIGIFMNSPAYFVAAAGDAARTATTERQNRSVVRRVIIQGVSRAEAGRAEAKNETLRVRRIRCQPVEGRASSPAFPLLRSAERCATRAPSDA